MPVILASFLLLGSLAISAVAADSSLERELDSLLAEEGLMGMSWGLLEQTGGVQTGALGLRDNSAALPFSVNTRFHVGSVTKSLLATGVLRLATTGQIDLDAPVVRYLPDHFREALSGQREAVTIRHLLDHTAGIDDARLWQMFSERPDPDTPLIEAFPDPLSLLRPRSQPGDRYSYSNMGYTLLGSVIETVSGQRYESYLDALLLAPLGMHDSTFAYTTQVGKDADALLAWGHVDDGTRYPAAPSYLRPAGQFTSTSVDLMRFARFLMSDGRVNGDIFIDEALMRARGRPAGTSAEQAGLIAGYALGLGRRDRHGVVGYCHGGNIIGFAAMLCIFPEVNKAFSYSINTDSETADYGRIQQALIKALAIPAAELPVPIALPDTHKAWEGWYVMKPNRFSTFEYLDNVFGAVHLAADNGTLTMTGVQQDLRRLIPVGNNQYSAADRATTSHVLLRGKNGEYLFSDGFKTYQKVSALLLLAYWANLLLGLVGVTWLSAAGLYAVLRRGFHVFRLPITPAFAGIALLLLPVPLFLNQSFMAMGDITLASISLALVTATLPPAMLWTVLRVIRGTFDSVATYIHGIAALFVLQWLAVLGVAGLLPTRLWG